MSYKSDAKSTYLTESGAVFAGRSRVKGVYVVPGTTAGTVVIKDGGTSGAAVATFGTTAGGSAVYIEIPEDGVLCATSSYATITNAASVTVFYA